MDKSIQKTTLYRYFDSEGQLLYVGITKNPLDRQSHHAANQLWWQEVNSATFEHFQQRSFALIQEQFVIGTELPKYNKQGPVLPLNLRPHLMSVIAGELEDEYHSKINIEIRNFMTDLNKWSEKPELHKLLFAFGDAIPWDADGEEMLIECIVCQQIIDSKWFKAQFDEVHSAICDEVVGK